MSLKLLLRKNKFIFTKNKRDFTLKSFKRNLTNEIIINKPYIIFAVVQMPFLIGGVILLKMRLAKTKEIKKKSSDQINHLNEEKNKIDSKPDKNSPNSQKSFDFSLNNENDELRLKLHKILQNTVKFKFIPTEFNTKPKIEDKQKTLQIRYDELFEKIRKDFNKKLVTEKQKIRDNISRKLSINVDQFGKVKNRVVVAEKAIKNINGIVLKNNQSFTNRDSILSIIWKIEEIQLKIEQGRPIQTEYETIEKFCQKDDQLSKLFSLYKNDLKIGISSSETLRKSFIHNYERPTRQALMAGYETNPFRLMFSYFLSTISSNETAYVEDKTVFGNLSRAAYYNERKDFISTVRELDQLEGFGRYICDDWVNEAKKYLELKQLLDVTKVYWMARVK